MIRRVLTNSAAFTYLATLVTVAVVVTIGFLAVQELTGGNWAPLDAPMSQGAR